ncbi:protein phosphatase regulator [Oleoguttula sp. CCFEE 5521]
MDAAQQDLVAQFCGVTGSTAGAATTALTSANWNLQEAVALYFAAQEGEGEDEEEASDEGGASVNPPASTSQPRAAAASSSSSAPKRAAAGSSRMKTLADLQSSAHDEDDSDSDPDLYTGGEKSGLAVQPNPGPGAGPSRSGGPVDHFRNILNQARKNEDRPPGTGEDPAADPTAPPGSTAFSGRAQTLGGDDAPSRTIDDPTAPRSSNQQRPTSRNLPKLDRTMHLWSDGVSIDDGPLFRFDDPANAVIMQQINRGQAPLSLLDVQPDQEVDLTLEPHKEMNYVQPKKKYRPFDGGGNRLGAPTPGPAMEPATTQQVQSDFAAMGAAVPAPPQNAVDESAPTLSLQIRLADGSRLSSRFNTTQTIGDVYNFVDRAGTGSGRAYALMTTFPSKELGDKGVVLGELGEFKRGGVVVQKWK